MLAAYCALVLLRCLPHVLLFWMLVVELSSN